MSDVDAEPAQVVRPIGPGIDPKLDMAPARGLADGGIDAE